MARRNTIFRVEPKKKQKEILNFLKSNQISILTGMPGVGKDFLCLYRALEGLNNKEFEEIVFMKPITEMGKSIGFLPGLLEDKFEPYTKSFRDNIKKMVDKTFYSANSKKFKFEPTVFLRGNTIEYSAVILSEAQNLTLHELISVVTRVSHNSKIYINGDLGQSDIKNSGFKDFINILKDVEGIDYVNLGDDFQMRNKMIVDITKKYQEFLKK